MRPTIRDVARQLKLSITTVSRALDGYNDVADTTRKLVIKTAEEMGYIPNRAARQLRRQRTDTIGYILPSDNKGFSDPFFSEFIAGLGDEASSNNYDLLVSAAASESEAEKNLYRRWVQGAKIGGIVINRVCLKDWRLQFLAEQNMPHVQLEASLDQPDFVGIELDFANRLPSAIEIPGKQRASACWLHRGRPRTQDRLQPATGLFGGTQSSRA